MDIHETRKENFKLFLRKVSFDELKTYKSLITQEIHNRLPKKRKFKSKKQVIYTPTNELFVVKNIAPMLNNEFTYRIICVTTGKLIIAKESELILHIKK